MVIDMQNIILSMPELYLYPACLVAWLLAALWTREPSPPGGCSPATVPTAGQPLGDAPVTAGENLDWALYPSSVVQPRCAGRPFQDLEATLSASYAARVEQAIRTIRIDPPAGAVGTTSAA
jgi:hypothetical protein